jgi:4-alpha-glucanotransferase
LPSKKSTKEKVLAEKPKVQEKPSNGTVQNNGKPINGDKPQKIQDKPTKATTEVAKKAPVEPVKKVAAPKKKTTAKPTVAAEKTPVKKAAAPKKSATKKIAEVPKVVTASVEFRLRFRTEFGQSLYILGDSKILGEMNIENAVPMEYLDTEHWTVRLSLEDIKGAVKYQYALRQKDGSFEYDWGLKTFDPSYFKSKDILVIDSWNHAGYYENVFYTEPFKDVLFEKASYNNTKSSKVTTHRFQVKAPLLQHGEVVCLLGYGEHLGNWNISAPLLLNKKAEDDFWTIDVDLTGQHHVEYKYGVYDTVKNDFVRYEGGNLNRYAPPVSKGQVISVNDGFAILPNTTWKGAGVAIPVFSLRTQRSFGVGEFTDLKLLIDWAKQIGLKMIQILPVNDTSATHTWTDSYPYAAISAFALHPMFLDLDKVADAKNKHLLQELEEKRIELNASPTVQYQEVNELKFRFIEKIYPLQKAATFKSKDFKDFFKANEHWLVPYAVFSYLRDEYGTSDFNQWPAHNSYNDEAVAALAKEGTTSHDKVNIHFFIQYHLHLQLKEATDYAHSKQIIVKGDIPIGVYRFGADAWQHPELFHMNVQAGAPPDDFAVKGQNWGFPTYNWDRMRQDGFEWWRQRFTQMSYYFDAFRIDHILGFFRIWSIPLHAVEGIMGRFVPAVPVHVNEFGERGIHFDYNRYCRPFITESILQEVFGERAGEVKETFLKESGWQQYALKDEFRTQRQVEQYFADKDDHQLKEGLYDLISNVILFEEEGSNGTKFHFRFGIEDTLSYREFDGHTKHLLKLLYVNYFFERQDHHWKIEAMQKLPGLKRSTNMLICGEDLGLVPHSVPDVMKHLGILSLEIQRMPKALKKQFFHPAEAPYLSVVTPSTHDMSTVRSWWEEDRTNTQKFYNNELSQPGDAPYYCEPWISKAIILQHLYSPAMWSIFQIQDMLGMSGELRREDPSEERINLPSNPKHYWNYRMHLNIEDLLKADEFNTELRDYLESSGRN